MDNVQKYNTWDQQYDNSIDFSMLSQLVRRTANIYYWSHAAYGYQCEKLVFSYILYEFIPIVFEFWT
jgi:hypothetical protein